MRAGEGAGGTEDNERPLSKGASFVDLAASVLLLFTLALAQPILEILGNNVEFFLARNSPTSDIVLLGVLMAIAAPLALVIVVGLVYAVTRIGGRILHASVFVALAGRSPILQSASGSRLTFRPACWSR